MYMYICTIITCVHVHLYMYVVHVHVYFQLFFYSHTPTLIHKHPHTHTHRFKPVSSIPSIKETIHKCYLITFKKYSLELDQLQTHYEQHKVWATCYHSHFHTPFSCFIRIPILHFHMLHSHSHTPFSCFILIPMLHSHSHSHALTDYDKFNWIFALNSLA